VTALDTPADAATATGPRTIAFVPPRYGDEVIGGAEAVLREAAHGLAARGHPVEVLTTGARDHVTWANEYPPGESRDGQVIVRRFPTVISTDRSLRARVEGAILAGHKVTLEYQQLWMNDDVRVPGLYHHLLAHSDRYRAIVFAPYLFWPTFAGAQIDPGRTILMPCLHDEPYARLDLFEPVFSGVRGLWFLSEPERDLARRLFALPPTHEVTGAGVPIPETYDPEGFRRRRGIEGRFIAYAGRREGAKRWEWLLDAFATAVARADLPFSLVTMGFGEIHPPASIADRVVDLGFVDEAERNDAFAAADAYVQPSANESFSRTVMESWLAGTPVLGYGGSEVVSWHIERSGAGLVFDDEAELEQCLRFVAERPDDARRLAARGRGYVLDHYQWPAVLDRMEATLDQWLPVEAGQAGQALRSGVTRCAS
jgi:glycosyltransferase involved in cell wall biosynthesis